MANCGSMLASATPTAADAACMFSSACRTSGRCSTSFEGRLTGRSVGRVRSLEAEGLRPAPRTAAGRAMRSGHRASAPVASAAAAASARSALPRIPARARSRSLAVPSARWLRDRVGQLVLHLEQPLGRRDLAAQRGLLHRGHDHVAAQASGRWPRAESGCSRPAPWPLRPRGAWRRTHRGRSSRSAAPCRGCSRGSTAAGWWGWSACRRRFLDAVAAEARPGRSGRSWSAAPR